MGRYGYLDMPEGWSDVSNERATVPCVECGCRFEADVEQTWIENGRVVAYCGCGELSDYHAEMREEAMYEHSGQTPWNRDGTADTLANLPKSDDDDRKAAWGGRRTPGPGKALGRPPLPRDEKKYRRWIFLRGETWEQLDGFAEETGETVSQLLQRWLDDQEDTNDETRTE